MSEKSTIKTLLERQVVKEKDSMKDLNLDNTVYVPVRKQNKDYLIKIDFTLDIENECIIESKTVAVIDSVIVLDQKVIAKKHPIDQLNLKYYYEKGKKLEVKNEM